MNSLTKNLIFWGVVFVTMVVLFNIFSKPRPAVVEKSYSDFIGAVENNRVVEAEVRGRNLLWKDVDGKRYKTYSPEDPDMIKTLREKRVTIVAKKED